MHQCVCSHFVNFFLMRYHLVRSIEAKLRELLHHPEFERLNDKHFKKFFKDGVIKLAALEDGAWREDEDARGDEGDDLPRNVPPPPALMGHSVLNHKAIDFRDIKISLDFWSHQSGNRRAYVNCDRPADHRRDGGRPCVKYVFLKDFETEEKCYAWLWCWVKGSCHFASQAEHRMYAPPEELVDQALAEA